MNFHASTLESATIRFSNVPLILNDTTGTFTALQIRKKTFGAITHPVGREGPSLEKIISGTIYETITKKTLGL